MMANDNKEIQKSIDKITVTIEPEKKTIIKKKIRNRKQRKRRE